MLRFRTIVVLKPGRPATKDWISAFAGTIVVLKPERPAQETQPIRVQEGERSGEGEPASSGEAALRRPRKGASLRDEDSRDKGLSPLGFSLPVFWFSLPGFWSSA